MQLTCIQEQLDQHATDPAASSDEETQDAKTSMQLECLGILLIQHSNLKQYGDLVVELQNNLTKAYDMLVNYWMMKQNSHLDHHDHGITYYTEDDSTECGSGQGGGHEYCIQLH